MKYSWRWMTLLTLVLVAAWAADRSTFLVDDPVDRDVVLIHSDALLERMVTRTQDVTGTVEFNPENILDDPGATFTIQVDTLTTGIPLRDEHMRAENCLDATRYPEIVFDLKSIDSPAAATALVPHRPLDLDITGELRMHGHTVEIPAKLTVTLLPETEETASRLPGDLLDIRGEFDLLLSDIGVDLGPAAALKVANRQHVELRLIASTERLVME